MGLIFNLWHIKRTNGLYFYAIDYIKDISSAGVVIVNDSIYSKVLDDLPKHNIIRVSFWGLLKLHLQALINLEYIFTPTSHPIPFLSNQIIVIHDDYPFIGLKGAVKKVLLKISLLSSRCKVACINNTTSVSVIKSSETLMSRRVFLPNKAPDSSFCNSIYQSRLSKVVSSKPPVIGLFGTDSPKKNYEKLFSALRSVYCKENYPEFIIYGHDTEYFKYIFDSFPDFCISLYRGDSMDAFLIEIDAVVSVASNEGFCRPVAISVASGIPCFLLRTPVFEEFYNDVAVFSESINEIAILLLDIGLYQRQRRNKNKFIENMNFNYYSGVDFLKSYL